MTAPIPPAAALARDAWRLGFGAMRAMPNLFGATFVLLVGFGLAFRWSHPPSKDLPGASELLFGFAADVATDVIAAAAMIAVHRLILLGDREDRPLWRLPPGYDRYLGWLVLLNLATLPAVLGYAWAGGQYAAPLVAGLVVLLAAGVALAVRLALVLPMAAMGAPGAGWRAAWEASRGRGWRLFGAAVLTFAPMEAAAMLVAGLFRGADGLAAVLLDALGGAGKTLLWAAVGAALWSRLLQAHAGALARPPVWR